MSLERRLKSMAADAAESAARFRELEDTNTKLRGLVAIQQEQVLLRMPPPVVLSHVTVACSSSLIFKRASLNWCRSCSKQEQRMRG